MADFKEGLSNKFLVKIEKNKANMETNLDLVEVSFLLIFSFALILVSIKLTQTLNLIVLNKIALKTAFLK